MNCGRADRYKNKGKNRNRMKNKLAISMFGQKRLSREGGIEIVVKELCTRMVRDGCTVTCYNRSGHHVSGAEYDQKTEYEGIRQKYVPTIEKKGLAAVSSSAFAALYSAFGKYDVVHIHAEGPAFFSWHAGRIVQQRVHLYVTLRPGRYAIKPSGSNELRQLLPGFRYPGVRGSCGR